MRGKISKFIHGISSFSTINCYFYCLYPFGLAERSVTFDFDNIGKDIQTAINNFRKENEQRK